MGNFFSVSGFNIIDNSLIRIPQKEAFLALQQYALAANGAREIGIILPVGCGKSGCITLAPFAFSAARTLVVAPGTNIASQLYHDFDPTQPDMFYIKTRVLDGSRYPEPVEIRGNTTNRGDLDNADVVVTNIQQLQGNDNNWLSSLPSDYFDLILFDEGHHNVANSWQYLSACFPEARIVSFSATPLRADGQRMAGEIIYSYPVFRAIQEGFIKRLKALVLNPRTLRYVRREDGVEVEVQLEEVLRLGEEDADFRRSIVTSEETLNTIVDASIRELDRIRAVTGDNRHKIIASALNFEHCRQIVQAYRSRGKSADYVHSREDSASNATVLRRLENNEIDVIVQVRKLGEGFDHKYLSVAAVFSIFSNLSPFIQFVGRIMRVVVQNDPQNVQNQGTVIFHAGCNIAQRWRDFQDYSEADQDYFDQLLPLYDFDLSDESEISITPTPRAVNNLHIMGQTGVTLEEIPLIQDNPVAMDAIRTLQSQGYTIEDVRKAMELQPVPTTLVRTRQAARLALDNRVLQEVTIVLNRNGYNLVGHELERTSRNRTNQIVLKSALDRKIARFVGRSTGQRSEYTQEEIDLINASFSELLNEAYAEVIDA